MITYQNEAVRLLLEICILLLKAKRQEIEVEQLNKISQENFGLERVAFLLEKKGFAIGLGFNEKTKQPESIKLIYPIEVYEATINKLDSLIYVPEEILYEDFRDFDIRDKVIWGIGEKAIVLVDDVGYDEECYHPRYPIGEKKFFNYEKNKKEAEKLASEIMDKYGVIKE